MFRAPELRNSGVNKVVFNKYPVSKSVVPVLHYEDGATKDDTEYKLYRGTNEK